MSRQTEYGSRQTRGTEQDRMQQRRMEGRNAADHKRIIRRTPAAAAAAMAFLLCGAAAGGVLAADSPVQQDTGEAAVDTAASSGAGTEETSSESADTLISDTQGEGTLLTTSRWELRYNGSWRNEEDYLVDDDYDSSARLVIPDGDSERVVFSIEASSESCDSYRRELHDAGIDARELVENGTVETRDIGGVSCAAYEEDAYWTPELYYYGRDEKSETTVIIHITGEIADGEVETLLNSITFTLPDSGNADPPWPWQGTPFTTDTEHTAEAAGTTLTATWIPLDEPAVAYNIFSPRIAAVSDESIWVLIDGELYEYSLGDTLTLKNAYGRPDGDGISEYAEISADSSGNLYLSSFTGPLLTMKDGTVTAKGPDIGYAKVHSSGTWGISWFYGKVPEKVTVTDGAAAKAEWPIISQECVSSAYVSENHVYISGNDAETNRQSVWVFDTEGNQQYQFGNQEYGGEQSIGSITEMIETDSGFLGIDGNMRQLMFWNADGSFAGSTSASSLFGTSYPWISTACRLSDGSILIGAVQERDDESAEEFLLYRLTGFQ